MKLTEEELTNFATTNKHFMFFTEDIQEMRKNGWTPKEIFRLGILAKKNNPKILDRLERAEEIVNSYSIRLTALNKRLYENKNELIELLQGAEERINRKVELLLNKP